MDPARGADVKDGIVLRRAAISAAVGAAMVLVYVLLGADAEVRPAMMLVVLAMLAMSAPGIVIPTWLPHSGRGLRAADVLNWLTLVGSAVLAYLDGGVASPLGFIMLDAVPLVGIVMSRRRLVRFAGFTAVLYTGVVVLGEPPPPGYVFVHALAFLMLTVVSAHHAETLRALRRRLARIAAVDPLTGCLNRGAFDRALTAELARAGRQGESVSLVLLDLDGFKRVNDQYGHGAGDDLLVWIGRTLRASARSNDVVGRIGGDEFAVLLSLGTGDLPTTVERLRTALAPRVSTSAGYATWPHDAEDEDALRHRADQRLYQDKANRSGRAQGTEVTHDGPAADGGPAAVEPTPPEEQARVVGGRWSQLPRTLRASLATVAEDRWQLTLAQMGGLGSLSCVVALTYVLAFSDNARDPWSVVACVVGLVLGALVVGFRARLARLRTRRLLITALNALNIALVVLVASRDGGVDSPLVLGLLNSIPLVALSAPPRLAAPHVAVLAGTYGAMAIGLGVTDPWMVAAHLGAYHSLALAYSNHARAAQRQWRALQRASRYDALTGCLNRRGHEEHLTAALARSGRTGVPVSLVVLDLDGFKAVNDTHGHAAGDELLRWVGERVRDTFRACDSVSRLGGDEFAVVLPDTDDAGAARAAERLREALAERVATSVGAATAVGPVYGVDAADGVAADGGAADGPGFGDVRLDAQSLYVRADRALYAEKVERRGGERATVCAH